MHDKKDFLYLEHRMNNVILPVRELMSNINGYFHNPLLTSKVIHFMRKVPTSLRIDKKLYKSAISSLFPELFSIPFATKSGNEINWAKEVLSAKDELIDFINSSSSKLDAIIPKDNIIGLLSRLEQESIRNSNIKIRFVSFGKSVFRKLKGKNATLDKLLARVIRASSYSVVATEKIILRILTLRTYLQV